MTDSIAATDDRPVVVRNVRWNVLALGADLSLFLIGLSFVSESTILPAFAAELGAPNVVIGAIPAAMTVGWFFPALFAAGHTATLSRKLPFVLRYTVWERAPFLALALVAFFLAGRAPGLALALLLVFLLVITGTGGLLMPAWMDIIGRTVPTSLRGRFFAVAGIVANLGGFVGSFGTAYLLATVAPPASYGICFVIAALFTGLSYVALALVREPASVVTSPPMPLRDYLRGVPGLLRGDRNLSWFLAARCVSAAGSMASGFYTVYALRAWDAPAWRVGVFTTALMAGQIVGGLVLGWLADRAGHLPVIAAAVAAMLGANLVALGAPSLDVFSVVFVLSGVHLAGMNVSALNVMLEFAPTTEARPTYLGLERTTLGPVVFSTPLVAGLLADTLGFKAIFAIAGLFGAAGVGLLVTRVRDPRNQRAGPA